MLSVKPHEFKEVILTLRSLSLKFGENLILRDVNQEIKNVVRPDIVQGQVVAILGRSGIGKTQLFRIIAGLQKPTTGEVLLGESMVPVKVGQVGVVSQNYYITPRLKIIDTLVRAGKQGGISTKAAREKGIEFLEKFGLAERRNFYPAQLSGGQRQRVSIIEQLVCSEDLLLMDEPFSGLDYLAKHDMCDLINQTVNHSEKNTIILVTHDIETACVIADTIWLMGRDRDEKGVIIPGARIVEAIDLMNNGFTWYPGIQFVPEFSEFIRDLQAKFLDLTSPYV